MRNLFILLLVMGPIIVWAQKVNEKIEKTANQVNETVETINALKNLFGKKNKNDEIGANANSKINSVAGEKYYIAGAVTNATKYIECDEMKPFNRGTAIIRKGTAYALIDGDANFVVPYGKFTGISLSILGSRNDLGESGFYYCTFNDENGAQVKCFINSIGKVVYVITNESITHFKTSRDNKYLIYANTAFFSRDYTTLIAVDYSGNKYKLTQDNTYGVPTDEAFRNDVYIYKAKVGDKILTGFKDLNNRVILKPTYNSISPFKEDVAIVGLIDALGKWKYGIIDKSGKELVNPVFNNEPTDFRDGVCLVKSNGYSNSAFIDKTGKVIFRQTDDIINKHGYVLFNVQDKFYTNTSVRLADGSYILIKDFLSQYGLDKKGISDLIYASIDINDRTNDHQLRVKVSTKSRDMQYALINLKDNTAVLGEFKEQSWSDGVTLLNIDPINRLIYAVLKLKTGKLMEGYMNTKGEFLIVKKSTAYTGL